jgi:hypothetical protein
MTDNRVLFFTGPEDLMSPWDIPISAGSWRVSGEPRRLTFGTLSEVPSSVSSKGTLALNVQRSSTELFLLPFSPTTGQPTGFGRWLTRDGRNKALSDVGGSPGSVYFSELKISSSTYQSNYYSLDLTTGKQTLVTVLSSLHPTVSPDGRHVAYSIPRGDSFSILLSEAGASSADARILCNGCGRVLRFSPDGRFLFYQPEATVQPNAKRKLTVRLLELASGKELPWLEHSSDSIGPEIDSFGEGAQWVIFSTTPPGSKVPGTYYVVDWTAKPVPPPQWIKIGLLPKNHLILPSGIFLYSIDSKLKAARFDPKARSMSAPNDITFAPGSLMILKADDDALGRSSGVVFTREAEPTKSVWLLKLPR